MIRPQFIGIGILIVLIFSCGCGRRSGNTPVLVPVSGVVTLDGGPLPKASIVFHSTMGGSSNSSVGRTNEKGEYSLIFSQRNIGAAPGSYLVEIRTREEVVDKDGNLVSDTPERLPVRYHDHSTLNVTVNTDNPIINFDLKSK
ncbi:MAG TPA: carboxypeptidase-like regulatory domain-containing protein [Planctomicrobium sp.]|nr:carboxypeptidase-like regulatory domain-containing protein [Planctomicrobium sp.]